MKTEKDPDNLWRHVSLATELGGAMVVPAIVGWLLGALLDRVLGTTPWLTILLLLCGIIAGLRSLFRMVMK